LQQLHIITRARVAEYNEIFQARLNRRELLQ
jgi:hypothetical protein